MARSTYLLTIVLDVRGGREVRKENLSAAMALNWFEYGQHQPEVSSIRVFDQMPSGNLRERLYWERPGEEA